MIDRRFLHAVAAASALAVWGPAQADEIQNSTAVFAGLDKITGRVVTFEASIDETVQFGTLQITARACYSKPPTEAPQTESFAQVDELTAESKVKRIFSGWMFAASPGLNGIEHPVYDVWLLECKGGKQTIPDQRTSASANQGGIGTATAPASAPIPNTKSTGHVFSPEKAAAALAAPDAASSRPAASPADSRPVTMDAAKSRAAPTLGPPVEIGSMPSDDPLTTGDDVARPGPLSPELSAPRKRPTRQYFPATEDDTPTPDFDTDSGGD